MRSLERFTSPEEEYAARIGTILKFGETAVYSRPHYSVMTGEADGRLAITNHDGLYSLDSNRLTEAQRQIHDTLDVAAGIRGIVLQPGRRYYKASVVSRIYHDEHIPDRTFLLHMLQIELSGRTRTNLERFTLQSSDNYTITETSILKMGGRLTADRILYPRADELTEAIDTYFSGTTDYKFRPIHVQARAALIGNETAARYLQGIVEVPDTEPGLRLLLQRVIDRNRIVGVKKETYLSPGPPSEAELDRITKLLFRAANLP